MIKQYRHRHFSTEYYPFTECTMVLNPDSHFCNSRNNRILARSSGTYLLSRNWKAEVGELLRDRHKLGLHSECVTPGWATY